jgi:transcriptional regulator with XRE-family HTH domain
LEQVLKRLGERFRELRVERGFKSQEKFAAFVGVDRTFMGHLETGRRDFRLSTIIRLADALDVAVAELFLEPGTSISGQKAPKIRRSAIERRRILETAADLERAAKTLKEVAGGTLKATVKGS